MSTTLLSLKPVQDPANFLDREWDKEVVLEQHLQRLESSVIVGEPRIGKTSFLLYLAAISPAHMDAIYIPLRGLVSQSASSVKPAESDFWSMMIESVSEQCGLPPFAGVGLCTYRDLVGYIRAALRRDASRRLVFLLDSVEVLFANIPSVLHQLRALTQTAFPSNVALVAASTDRISELYKRFKLNSQDSPWGNDTYYHTLGLLQLSDEEMQKFVARAAEADGLLGFEAARYVDLITRKAGHHPDVLKATCSCLFQVWRQLVDQGEDPGHEQFYRCVERDLSLQLGDDRRVQWLCDTLLNRRSPEQKNLLALLAREPDASVQASDAYDIKEMIELGLLEKRDGHIALFSEVFTAYLLLRPTAPIVQPAIPPLRTELVTLNSSSFYLPDQGAVLVNGQLRPLTRLENRLLEYLVQHANKTCSNQDLLTNVWGSGRSREVVEKGVNRLRQKLERDPDRPQILVSIWGQGYQLMITQA